MKPGRCENLPILVGEDYSRFPVDAHRANIKEKLDVKTSAELISFTARWIADRPGTKQTET